jgi:hypothetical protein
MSSAGQGHEGEPAASDSARPDTGDDGVRADPVSRREFGMAATSGPVGTTTAVASPATPGSVTQAPPTGGFAGLAAIGPFFRRLYGRRWARHVGLLLIYLVAGIAATWPRFTYLADGLLPKTTDATGFVWDYWWVAHQVAHLGNPFTSCYMAAPACIQLGYSTLMPLASIVMTPVTLIFGPSASFTVVSLITPGLLCYAMFRMARLWLNVPGSIAAGALYGLSSMMLWQVWYHINITLGLIFIPLTIEAAIRLRRSQKISPAIGLGAALGAAIMTSQEGGAIALILTLVLLVPWLIGKLVRDRATLRRVLLPLGIGAVVALVIASPQLIAMAQQIAAGGAKVHVGSLAVNYTQFGAPLQTLFSPSPRLTYYGLGHLGSYYSYNTARPGGLSVQPQEGLPTFGIVLSALGLLGLVIGWRQKGTRWFGLLWAVGALLALGTSIVTGTNCVPQAELGRVSGSSCHQYMPFLGHIHWAEVTFHGVTSWRQVLVSNLMPYSWLVRIPGLAGLREADRFALVGLIGAALLAGIVVQWISERKLRQAVPLMVVVTALAVLELGWTGGTDGPPLTPSFNMATTFSAIDSRIAADHSKSIVVDLPWGLRGGLSLIGSGISDQALLLATSDGHPRAESYSAWVPWPTINAMEAHPFFRLVIKYQGSTLTPTPSELQRAAADLKTLHIGWVVEWDNLWRLNDPAARLQKLENVMYDLGFRKQVLACLVPSAPGTGCPPLKRVWLWKYEPAHAYTGAGTTAYQRT